MKKMPGNNTEKNNNNNSNMDSSFYDDGNAQFASSNSIKRPISLDLNSKNNPVKKLRLNDTNGQSYVLESPDFQSLKFNTPDLEKFILTNNSLLSIPTPNLVFPPVKATSEQEDFSKGFVEALEHLRNNDNVQQITQPNTNSNSGTTNNNSSSNTSNNNTTTTVSTTASVVTTNGMSGGSITYTNLDENFPVAIKDEPQTVPTSPPLSPIDMEDQEKIKLERKRQRNRVAASKCRKRKLERISKLEDKVKILKSENVDLGSIVRNLKENVYQLKQEVISHIHSGCSINIYGGSNSSMLETST